MEAFLIRFGLLAVFLGAAVEGDVTAILAGVVAHLGFFDLPSAIVAGLLGAMLSDGVCYAIGRSRADTIRQSELYRRAGFVIDRLAQRLGVWEIVVARFVYGARIASMLFWGMQRLPLQRFAPLDFVGCALWSSVLTALGFGFSGSVTLLIGRVRRAEIWLLVALVLTAAVVLMVRRAMHQHLHSLRAKL